MNNKKLKFSIICVFNDKKIVDECLLASLNAQNRKFELILIDNTSTIYSSAAKALNHGGHLSNGEYMIFIHQDVVFFDGFLQQLDNYISKLPAKSIFGVAGRKDDSGVITNIWHGNPLKIAGGIQIEVPTTCQTLDEVFMVIPRALFEQLEFDEDVCSGWHLYVVDFCLTAKTLGYDSYVLPIRINHMSSGYSMNNSYYQILRKVVLKHKNAYPIIYTTVGRWRTSLIGFRLFVKLRIYNKTRNKKIRKIIKRLLL